MPLAVAFWVVAGLTALLLAAWALDRGTDPASRGIGGGYALVGLPFLALGVLVFFLSRGTALRGVAIALAAVPLLAVALMAANARFGYILDNYRKSPAHMFGSSTARDLGKAIERQDLAAIRRLAAAGADLNEIGRDERSPLSFALDRNALDAAALLLELGADPTKGEGEGGRAPLTEIVATDARSELLKIALRHGASPEFTDKWGVPMVHWAVTSRCMKNLEVLVAAGARLDRRDDEHQLASPVSCALDRREWAYARFLVEHGAPVREAPGWNGLDAKFGNADPPAAGSPDRAEYDALVKAMVERGFTVPAGR